TGLIRYDSFVGLSGGRTRWFRSRTILYSLLMLLGAAAAGLAFSTVRPAAFSVTRMTGAPYVVSAEAVRNQFLVRLVNKRDTAQAFRLELVDTPAALGRTGFDQGVTVAGLGETVVPLVLQMPRESYAGRFHFTVLVHDVDGGFTLRREIEFVGPDPELLREET